MRYEGNNYIVIFDSDNVSILNKKKSSPKYQEKEFNEDNVFEFPRDEDVGEFDPSIFDEETP
jgi:hypothetical protein